MAVRKFAGEDGAEPFRDWVAQKPRGYVLTTDKGLSDRASTRLHRVNCFTLEPGFGGGDRQTRRLHEGLLAGAQGAQRVGGREPRVRAARPALPALRPQLSRPHRLTGPDYD